MANEDPERTLHRFILIVGAISISLGIFAVWSAWESSRGSSAIWVGAIIAVGSFLGLSRVFGPMMNPPKGPGSYDSPELRSYKQAVDVHRTAEAIKRIEAQVVAPSPPVAASTDDVLGQLQQLANLHAAGILSDEEFATKKARLLRLI